MKHELPKLEYNYNALEPFIDETTMKIHHSKHHQAYVDKLNAALEKYPELQKKKVEELLANNLKTIPEEIRTAVRNHGGGHLNHSFFWKILAKDKPISSKFKKILEQEFETFENFKELFANAALNRFGSGWAWLIFNPITKKLEITSTQNQDSPLIENKIPLLGLDVWEHAYYLKYQNRRADYISAFWNIINWEQVEENYNDSMK
jgi:superoxide dismutase, Fe-Mn family